MLAIRLRTVLLISILLLAGCRQQQLGSADVQLELSASDQRVGETTLLVRVSDRDGAAVSDPGKLQPARRHGPRRHDPRVGGSR